MGAVADFLGDQLHAILKAKREYDPTAGALSPDFVAKLTPLFTSPHYFHRHAQRVVCACSAGYYRDWLALEAAAGAPAEVVRSIARQPVEAWVEILPNLEFSDRSPAPMLLEFHKALECAAISGDRALAQSMASGYPLPGVDELKTQFDIRPAVLRHLLAGEEEQATQLAAKLEPGYMAEFVPALIEFPLGVVKSDAEMLAQAMAATAARLQGQWDVKKWRKKHGEAVKEATARRPADPWEKFREKAGESLIARRWMLSTWGLAFVNVAAWRGMAGLFEREKLFSEWFPRDLCCGR